MNLLLRSSSTEPLSFDALGLHPTLLAGVRASGFTHCTPIQAHTLPFALQGQDIAGQAQTGTGKTAAFLLALMQRLLSETVAAARRPNQPRAVIMAPTRELAVQIYNDALTLGAQAGLRYGVVYGGAGYDSQRTMLQEGVDVVIATPGRLIDYFRQHIVDLRAVEVLVLDEADRMFDLGFIRDIRFLLRRMPPPEKRLSMLFSATLSWRVTELAYEHMNNPHIVRIETGQVTADNVTQTIYHTAAEEKLPLLVGLLKNIDARRSIVFVNTKRAAEQVQRTLEQQALHAATLSGDVPQKKRLRLLGDFQSGRLPILVATDVAARGLHIPEVSHVFNFDLPHDAEDYVHRIGRTARAGASGQAVSFACEEYAFSLPEIEAYIGFKIPVSRIDAALLADLPLVSKAPRDPGVRPAARRRPRRPKSTRTA